jgi:hypothetical protein
MEIIIANENDTFTGINIPSRQKDARRTANGVFAAWESRTELVKQQANAERTATDAKTARLKALRLEKEAADAEAARIAAENAPPAAPKKPRVKRTAV